jgi:nucleoside permease NupC
MHNMILYVIDAVLCVGSFCGKMMMSLKEYGIPTEYILHHTCLYCFSSLLGATIFDGIKDIENTDWTDTFLSKYQKKLLCSHPTAKGTNPVTGVDTRESLMCTD